MNGAVLGGHELPAAQILRSLSWIYGQSHVWLPGHKQKISLMDHFSHSAQEHMREVTTLAQTFTNVTVTANVAERLHGGK